MQKIFIAMIIKEFYRAEVMTLKREPARGIYHMLSEEMDELQRFSDEFGLKFIDFYCWCADGLKLLSTIFKL